MSAALELEVRINQFMSEYIVPFIVGQHDPNHACDRFMVLVGGWADVSAKLRWPYRSIPKTFVEPIRQKAKRIIPEFFKRYIPYKLVF